MAIFAIEGVLARAEERFRTAHDEDEQLAALVTAAIEFNHELADAQTGSQSMEISGDLGEKIQKAITKFKEWLTDLCQTLGQGTSFSIGASLTGISIAVSFPARP